MKYLRHLLLLITLGLTVNVHAQQSLNLLVYKGKVTISGQGVCGFRKVYRIAGAVSVTADANSFAVVYTDDERHMGEINTAGSWTCQVLVSRLRSIPVFKGMGFWEYLRAFGKKSASTKVGSVPGGIRAHDGESDTAIFPWDGALLLSDNLTLQWPMSPPGNIGSLTIQTDNEEELTSIAEPRSGRFPLATLSPGVYIWNITQKDGTLSFEYTFEVPTDNIKKECLQQIAQFQSEITPFSPPLQAMLLQDYLRQRGWAYQTP